jgi:hypothetical protein
MCIDHINGDTYDNRLSNLRLATTSQNAANAKLSSANTTGLKGLYWNTRKGKWRGEITANKRAVSKSGDLLMVAAWLFRTREELHGEFARHH